MRIALIEDDQDQIDLLCLWLEAMEHDAVVYTDGTSFIQGLVKESYDLIVLDWMLPNITGIEVLRHIRSNNDQTPVLFVTAKDAEEDIVQALEAGADDYMAKPISESETKARIKALMRRSGSLPTEQTEFTFDPYSFDTKTRELALHGKVVSLTQKEYELMVFLLRNEGRVISRGHLLQVVWGTSPQINTRTVDTHISRLRNKLDIKPESSGWELSSIYQHGYRLEQVKN